MKTMVSLLLALALSACIVVDDFGAYWAKGKTDPCINDLLFASMNKDNEKTSMSTIRQTVRVLTLGEHHFIMMRRKPDSKGGDMIRYVVENGEYVSFRLDKNKRGDFLRSYPDSQVVVTEDTATIPVLNDQTVETLTEVAEDDSYWIEASREPYNPRRRTDCRHK